MTFSVLRNLMISKHKFLKVMQFNSNCFSPFPDILGHAKHHGWNDETYCQLKRLLYTPLNSSSSIPHGPSFCNLIQFTNWIKMMCSFSCQFSFLLVQCFEWAQRVVWNLQRQHQKGTMASPMALCSNGDVEKLRHNFGCTDQSQRILV